MSLDNKIKRFNENSDNYHLIWNPVNGDVEPRKDGQYLVTIKKRDFDDEVVVTIGSYNYNPFSKKWEWTHGNRTIAFAELPNPYNV